MEIIEIKSGNKIRSIARDEYLALPRIIEGWPGHLSTNQPEFSRQPRAGDQPASNRIVKL